MQNEIQYQCPYSRIPGLCVSVCVPSFIQYIKSDMRVEKTIAATWNGCLRNRLNIPENLFQLYGENVNDVSNGGGGGGEGFGL